MIINGDNIQRICDHYIGKRAEFEPQHCYNPNLEEHKIVIFEDIVNEYNNGNIVFIYTHLLDGNYGNLSASIEDTVIKLKFMKNPFKLVVFNSDTKFDKKCLKLFEVKNLKHIYTQNLNCLDSRVTPLPLGLTRNMYPHGDMSIMYKVIAMNITKRKGIYFNFQISTNPKHRQDCYDKIKQRGIKWIENKPFENYLKELASHKFCISPEGNGIDCHRTWEALYLKTIPICKRSILTEHFSKMFPIVLIDDWSNLPPLRYKDFSWENYHKLDFGYWEKVITKDKL